MESMTLDQLRASQGLTQVQIAEKLGMTQAAVSKLEFRKDSYISTVRRFIEAIGGKLEVQAVLPDRRISLCGLDGDETISNLRGLVNHNCRLTPLNPATGNFRNYFTLRHIDDDERMAEFQKDNYDIVSVPVRRIIEVLPGPSGKLPTVVLNGRVQWYEESLRWRFVE